MRTTLHNLSPTPEALALRLLTLVQDSLYATEEVCGALGPPDQAPVP